MKDGSESRPYPCARVEARKISWRVLRLGGGVHEAAGFKKPGAVADAFEQVAFHGAEGNVEALGDFLAGAAVEVAEQHDLATTFRKGAQRFGDGFAMLATFYRLDDGGGGVEEGQFDEPIVVGEGFVRVDVAPAEEIDGGVAGGGEKKGFGMSEAIGVGEAEEPDVGLLHEVVMIGQGGETPRKIGAESGLVGLHVLGKPAGLFGRGHRG